MLQEGKLDLIGISNVDRATARRALELVDVAAIQNGYSIIDPPERRDGRVRPRPRDRLRAVLPAVTASRREYGAVPSASG